MLRCCGILRYTLRDNNLGSVSTSVSTPKVLRMLRMQTEHEIRLQNWRTYIRTKQKQKPSRVYACKGKRKMDRENIVADIPTTEPGPPSQLVSPSDGAASPNPKAVPLEGGDGGPPLTEQHHTIGWHAQEMDPIEADMLNPPMPEAFDAVGYKDLELETTRMPLEATFVSSMTPRTMRIHLRARGKNQLKQEHLDRLLPEIPPENTSYHVISRGNFDFWNYVPHLVKLAGSFDETYLSTWTMCRDVAVDLLTLADQNKLGSITLISGTYFKRRETVVYGFVLDGLLKRGHRYKAFMNHIKLILLRNNKMSLVLESSANLTANPNAESFTISNHSGLYDFHREWIEAIYGGDRVK